MTARLMADSTQPDQLPSWVSIKCFYVDGQYAATPGQISAWKGPKVLINVTGDPAHGGDCLDVETGDATPADIPGWYDQRHADGARYLSCYSNRDQFDACTTAIGDRDMWRWLATLDNTILRTYNGVTLAAVQAFPRQDNPTNIDLSIVFAEDWHPEAAIRVSTAERAAWEMLAEDIVRSGNLLIADLRNL